LISVKPGATRRPTGRVAREAAPEIMPEIVRIFG